MFSWNEKLAYAVGLLVTDGSLSKDKRHICFTSKDIDLISTFRDCLAINNKIGINPRGFVRAKTVYRVQFGNVNFYRWLESIGLTANKTFSLGKINIPDDFFFDFLRGHLDGDGCVLSYKDSYNKNPNYVYDRLYVYFYSSSADHIKWLRSVVIRLVNVRGSLREESTSFFRLKFAKKESIKLLKQIYYKNNLPLLKRKYIIAMPFIKS